MEDRMTSVVSGNVLDNVNLPLRLNDLDTCTEKEEHFFDEVDELREMAIANILGSESVEELEEKLSTEVNALEPDINDPWKANGRLLKYKESLGNRFKR
jgi:hypothetical protein